MTRFILGLGALVALATLSTPVFAADYAVSPQAVERAPNPYCSQACGCPIVTYVRHRQLEAAYSYTFDPRLRDEPHYYYGPRKTYARFENNCPHRVWN